MKRNLSIGMTGTVLVALAIAASGCGGGKTDTSSASEPTPAAPAAEPAKVENELAAEPAAAAEPVIEEAAAEAAPAVLAGDPVKGKRVFIKCMACHSIAEGENKIGPSLHKIVDAPAGQVANFNYSTAIASSGIAWTDDILNAYLENPAKYLPGNKMLFPGLPSAQDRADVIAYLKSAE